MAWLGKAAVLWALDEAPDVPAHLVAALIAIARYAGEDGRGAHPSAATIAAHIRKSERNAKKDIAELEKLGLLLPGDKRIVAPIRADRRPNVYDLPMPRGDAQDTPSTHHGVSHTTARGVAQSQNGVSHTTPEEILKRSRKGARRAADADAHAEPENQRTPADVERERQAMAEGRKAAAATACPGCQKPFSPRILGLSPQMREMAYAGTLICGFCRDRGFKLDISPAPLAQANSRPRDHTETETEEQRQRRLARIHALWPKTAAAQQ